MTLNVKYAVLFIIAQVECVTGYFTIHAKFKIKINIHNPMSNVKIHFPVSVYGNIILVFKLCTLIICICYHACPQYAYKGKYQINYR